MCPGISLPDRWDGDLEGGRVVIETSVTFAWNAAEGTRLCEWIARYAAGEDACRETALGRMRQAEEGTFPPEAEAFHCAAGLFFALDQTGEIRYRRMLDQMAQTLESMPQPVEGMQLWWTQPFRAAYDVRFGGRQRARAIAELFRRVRDGLRPDQLYAAWYLLAVSDTAERMDSQIYEHYRVLADLLLEAAQAALRNAEKALADMAVSYALLKGVRLDLLDPERYALPALRAVETCREHPFLALARTEYGRAAR